MTSLKLEVKPHNILLAHGNDAMRHLLRDTLHDAGYRRLVMVDSGRGAINRLLRGRFDLLVIGTQLPDIDGWRLTRMVHSGRFHPATLPVIIVCDAKQHQISQPQAKEHGAYLLPINDVMRLPDIAAGCIDGYTKAKPTVLVIEDDERAANLIRLSLHKDYDVEMTYDGETGLAAWKARQHQLVLLDAQLPGLSGPEVLRQIIEINPTQAVIIITAYATVDRHRDLMLAGAADFIAKPFDLGRLRRICDQILRHSEYLHQCTQLQHENSVRQELNNRLRAANRCLATGQTGMASYHLKNALAVCTERIPTDDEWARMLTELD